MYYSLRPQNGITLSGVKKVCNGKLTIDRDLNLFFEGRKGAKFPRKQIPNPCELCDFAGEIPHSVFEIFAFFAASSPIP